MGCGASKGAEAVVAQPQAKATEKCSSHCSAAAPALPGSLESGRADSGSKNDVVMREASGSKAGDLGGGLLADDKKPGTMDGLKKPPSIKTLSVMVIAEPQCIEQDAVMPERPASAEQAAEPSCPGNAAPDENPARAAFRARVMAQSPDDLPPSPVAFRSMRSLNRSIGVRRRDSDQGSSLHAPEQGPASVPEPEPCGYDFPYPDPEEEEDKGPDPLKEQFEMNKERNPLLALGRKPTGNGILSCKAVSEKSLKAKSQKRLAVGFALDGNDDAAADAVERPASGGTASANDGGAGGGGKRGSASSSQELDPDDHMEAERIASVSAMREEAPAPVVATAGP